ncbi:hypothetical protein R1sor_017226 [Riccia sorocarpa]|uniref:Uncharacterized protein n=1 Tax=Riccia sorocarpa TaxID=122646 RepID=A0ABD3I806_9MARC
MGGGTELGGDTNVEGDPTDGSPSPLNTSSSEWRYDELMDLEELDGFQMVDPSRSQLHDDVGTLGGIESDGGMVGAPLGVYQSSLFPEHQEPESAHNVAEAGRDTPGVDRCPAGRGSVTSQVFKLLDIRQDNQDLSFVEKVIPSEQNIFALCDALVPRSAKKVDGHRTIDFSRLESVRKMILGFYGSKEIMIRIFRKLAGSRFHMHLREECLATERYLIDLCDTVYVCVEGDHLEDRLFNVGETFSKRKRTQRLQISLVKATENSVSLDPGFSLVLEHLPEGNKAREYRWTEGSSRLALLASFPQIPKVRTHTGKEMIKRATFSSVVGNWMKDYSLDLSKLADSDLLVFLAAAKWEQYQEFQTLEASHKKRKEMWSDRKGAIDKLKEDEEDKLRTLFISYIDICLRIEFPVEHGEFSVERSSSGERGNSSSWPTATEDSKASESSTSPEVTLLSELIEMEKRIYATIFGDKIDTRFLFPGDEVRIQADTVPDSKSIGILGQLVHTLEYYDDGKTPKKYEAFQNGEVVVLKSSKATSRSPGLHNWIQSEVVSAAIKNLRRKATVVTFALPQLDAKKKRNYKGDLTQMFLEAEDVLREIKPFLTKEVYNSAEALWQGCDESGSLEIDEDVRKICIKLYKFRTEKVSSNIWLRASEQLESFLNSTINTQLDKEFDQMTADSRKEKAEFVSKAKTV